MLIKTTQKPDEISDILHKKYGRREMIMEELLQDACKVPIDSLESLIHFNNIIRNVSAEVEGRIE